MVREIGQISWKFTWLELESRSPSNIVFDINEFSAQWHFTVRPLNVFVEAATAGTQWPEWEACVGKAVGQPPYIPKAAWLCHPSAIVLVKRQMTLKSRLTHKLHELNGEGCAWILTQCHRAKLKSLHRSITLKTCERAGWGSRMIDVFLQTQATASSASTWLLIFASNIHSKWSNVIQ